MSLHIPQRPCPLHLPAAGAVTLVREGGDFLKFGVIMNQNSAYHRAEFLLRLTDLQGCY